MGNVIGFYKPSKANKPKPVKTPDPDAVKPSDVLAHIHEAEDKIEDLLVMIRYKDGELGFLTNVADFGESLLFIERVKFRAMTHDAGGEITPPKSS